MVRHLADGRLSRGNVLHGVRARMVVRCRRGGSAVFGDGVRVLGGHFHHAGNVLRVGLLRLDVAVKARREKILARQVRTNNFAVACRVNLRRAVGDVHNPCKSTRAGSVLGILHDAVLGRVLSAGAVLVPRRADGTLRVVDMGVRPVPEIFDAGAKFADGEIFRGDIRRERGDGGVNQRTHAARHVEIFRLRAGFATRANSDLHCDIFCGRAGLATRLVRSSKAATFRNCGAGELPSC